MSFHENGKIKSGILAADTTIAGVTYEAETKIEFDENGRVRN
jgi:hypothetical protein